MHCVLFSGNANDRPVVLDVLRQFEQYDVKVVAVGINTQVSHITDTSIKINGQFTEQIIDQVAINICRGKELFRCVCLFVRRAPCPKENSYS